MWGFFLSKIITLKYFKKSFTAYLTTNFISIIILKS